MILRSLTLCLLALPSVASADVVVLRDGRRIEGEVQRDARGVEVRNRFGRARFARHQVLRIEEAPSAEDRLAERRATVDREDVGSWLEFADWARAEGFGAAATEALESAIELDPEHLGARQRLGHRRVGERWLPFEEAMAAEGKVRDGGEWVDRQVAEERKAARVERERLRRLQRRVDALGRQLAGSSDRRRDEARDQLLQIALAERQPRMGQRVHALHSRYRDYWATQRTLLEIRTSTSRLTGMETFSTSLGSGAPVRIQLPRMRTISIGTTVVVPGG